MITLEVKEKNGSSISLYTSVGFYDTGIRYDDDCAFVKLPSRSLLKEDVNGHISN
ncbi:hypothetical protein D3C77_320650 [compost metagenome]